MIVEFVGSSGAGKTTLAFEVQRRLARKAQVVTSFELAAGLLGLRRVANPTLQNLAQDLVALPFFFRALFRHRAFVAYALRSLARQSRFSFYTANYLRSIIRKIGIYEVSKRYGHDRIVLVDEGTVLSAYLLFVFTRNVVAQEEIEAFASLVPLPDLVVCVEAPLDSLVQRSLRRGDVRREMRSKNEEEVEEILNRAAELFGRLAESERIRDRVLVVANPAATEGERGIVADRIATVIINRGPSVGAASCTPAVRVEPGTVIGEHRVG